MVGRIYRRQRASFLSLCRAVVPSDRAGLHGLFRSLRIRYTKKQNALKGNLPVHREDTPFFLPATHYTQQITLPRTPGGLPSVGVDGKVSGPIQAVRFPDESGSPGGPLTGAVKGGHRTRASR